jgi:hypothetical protein
MTVLTFDEIVAGMRAQGVPVEMAERAARRELGQTGPIAGAEIETDALEDVHVNEGKRLVRALGGFVYSSVQKRRAKVTPGQPDTLFFFPKHRLMVWWEATAGSGRCGVMGLTRRHFAVSLVEKDGHLKCPGGGASIRSRSMFAVPREARLVSVRDLRQDRVPAPPEVRRREHLGDRAARGADDGARAA